MKLYLGPQIKVKKALRAALRRPKSRDAALYAELIQKWLNLTINR